MNGVFKFLLLLSVIFMTGCKAEEPVEQVETNIMNGTKWAASSESDVYVMHFISDSKVQVYTADISGNPKYQIVTANYAISKNEITFPDYANMIIGAAYVNKFYKASISGNVMTATYTPEFLGTKLSDGTIQFLKK